MTKMTRIALVKAIITYTYVVIFVNGECPAKFIHLEEGCYHFSDDPLVREEAWNYCLALTSNSDLVSIDSCSEFVHISHYLETNGFLSYDANFWTGDYVAGDYLTGTNISKTFHYGAPYWDPYASTRNGGCAKMPSKGGYLIPGDAYKPGYPLCEIKVPGETTVDNKKIQNVDCPKPFVAVGERCFYVNGNASSWDDSRNTCASLAPGQNANLAVFSDCSSFASIAQYLENSGADKNGIWVGSKDFEGLGTYRWLNGDYLVPGVPFWCPGEPNGLDGNETCVMLWGARLFYGADEDCSALHTSLCEIGL